MLDLSRYDDLAGARQGQGILELRHLLANPGEVGGTPGVVNGFHEIAGIDRDGALPNKGEYELRLAEIQATRLSLFVIWPASGAS